MAKRKNKKFKSDTIRVDATDPGLGYSPYLREKSMGYTKDDDDIKRDKRRQNKRELKDSRNWED